LEKQYCRRCRTGRRRLRFVIPAGGSASNKLLLVPVCTCQSGKIVFVFGRGCANIALNKRNALDERVPPPPPLRAPSAPLRANHCRLILISRARAHTHTLGRAALSPTHARPGIGEPVKRVERERTRITPTQRATDRLPD
jgi:hypothetical protein